jgi:hypothetical protein
VVERIELGENFELFEHPGLASGLLKGDLAWHVRLGPEPPAGGRKASGSPAKTPQNPFV